MSVEGAEELKAAFSALSNAIGATVAKEVLRAGRRVQNYAIRSVQRVSGQGKTVTRYHAGQAPYQHTASLPGQAPNTDTGELARGIQLEVVMGDVQVGVESSQDEKANALEFGTTDGKLAPRPLLFPALEATREENEKAITAAVLAEVNKANGR